MKLKLLLIVFLLSQRIFSQVNVDGYIFLENQSQHDGIEILFERTAPSAYTASSFSNANGYFNIQIETGIYQVTYSKTGFFTKSVIDISIYSNMTLQSDTLTQRGSYIIVPEDFSSIQSAIDYVSSEDTIIVEPGIYYENIIFNGKKIVLTSNFIFSNDTNDILNTIIDGGQNGQVVKLVDYETSETQLIGFTIRNGQAQNLDYFSYDNSGGGICCYRSDPTLSNLIVSNNSTTSTYSGCSGGGIYLYDSQASLVNIVIKDNNASRDGGGIGIAGSSNPQITNCTIKDNNTAEYGGGIYIEDSWSEPVINATVIQNNTAPRGAGIFMEDDAIIMNSIISNNIADIRGGGIYIYGGYLNLINSNIINNNANDEGSGIFICCGSSVSVSNCIVMDNQGQYGLCNYMDSPATSISINNSIFYNNTPTNFYNCSNYFGLIVTVNQNGDSCDAYNNIFVNPLLNEDYALQNGSPCIDVGLNSAVLDSGDFVGNVRIWDGNNDQIRVVDIGALEYGAPIYNSYIQNDLNFTKNDIILYPNPCNDIINIKMSNYNKSYFVEIYNSTGNLHLKKKMLSSEINQVDLSDCSSGIFFIKISSDEYSTVRKIIIMKN